MSLHIPYLQPQWLDSQSNSGWLQLCRNSVELEPTSRTVQDKKAVEYPQLDKNEMGHFGQQKYTCHSASHNVTSFTTVRITGTDTNFWDPVLKRKWLLDKACVRETQPRYLSLLRVWFSCWTPRYTGDVQSPVGDTRGDESFVKWGCAAQP